jgi:broad specificity phosphatase PhoE
MHASLPEVYLARHGETAWTLTGQHTGRTDIPLTARGEQNAMSLRQRLNGVTFATVLVSPLVRARRTCELAGFGDTGTIVSELQEWDYGDYEGRRTADIRRERPDWDLFRDAIGARADRVIARLRAVDGHVLLFSHGHFLRVLAARWLGLPADKARLFVLSTAALSILGYEHNLAEPAIRLWNDDRHVVEEYREPVEKRGNL